MESTATALSLAQRRWRIETEQQELTSQCDPGRRRDAKKLNYLQLKEIPLEVALDPRSSPRSRWTTRRWRCSDRRTRR